MSKADPVFLKCLSSDKEDMF